MGPLPYNELYSLWTDMEARSSFEPNCSQLLTILVNRLDRISRDEVHEGILSSQIARTISEISAIFDNSIQVLHQLYSPDKTYAHVDIALLDSKTDATHAHSLLAIKWAYDVNEFPEIEVTAFARLLAARKALASQWIPVFVLSKTHFRIGVAFNGIAFRWAYSEIFCFFNDDGSWGENVLMLMRFARFLIQAADFHRKWKDPNQLERVNLVDNTGSELIQVQNILGCRVLLGSAKGQKKIIKFFSSHDDAQRALDKQSAISKVLNPEFTAKLDDLDAAGAHDSQLAAQLVKGCAPGLCVIVDNYIPHSLKYTNKHLLTLARTVDRLHKAGWVHGDLRLCNVLFGGDDSVQLIDFEWAGKVGEAKFPENVRIESFGTNSSKMIEPSCIIPENFDWMCLADIFSSLGCAVAARLAALGEVEGMVDALSSAQVWELSYGLPNCLDLARLGMHFYSRTVGESGVRRKAATAFLQDSAPGERKRLAS